MKIYKSCNCFVCRTTPSSVKKEHKRKAHKQFRKAGKNNPEEVIPVSTGYRG